MLTVPGIHMSAPAHGLAGHASPAWPLSPTRHSACATLGDWLQARIDSRFPVSDTVAQDPVGVTVLLEGYVTRIAGHAHDGRVTAREVLRHYLDEGVATIARLRGSFTGAILDTRDQHAHLFNDRRATRPLYLRQDETGIHAGPELAVLARLGTPLNDVDPVAICQFVLFASYYGDRTLFRHIRKLPPATVLTLVAGGKCTLARYWQLVVDPDRPAGGNEEAWIERLLEGLDASCRQLSRAGARPALLLSGGGDSRAILACLGRTGQTVDAVTYGTAEGDDAPVARRLAQAAGMPFEYLPIDAEGLERHFHDAAMHSDGAAETIDSPTMAAALARIASTHDAFVHGDKSIYGKVPGSAAEAFDSVGLWGLERASRFADMLDPGIRASAQEALRNELADLRTAGRHWHPVDLRDWLYFQQRLANRQNGFAAMKLRYLEQFRPWLDEDLVELLMQLPPELRADEKALVRRVTARAAPDLAAIPYAARDSIPQSRTYQAQLARSPAMARFFTAQFHEAFDPRLAAIFRAGVVQGLVDGLSSGQPAPAPVPSWWQRLPGMWRLPARRYASDRIHPVRIVMRLMQINLFLASHKDGADGRPC